VDLDNLLPVYVVHYSLLTERKAYLSPALSASGINAKWITEKSIRDFKEEPHQSRKILGVNEKLVGMDLGINSRSLSRTRRRARLEGWCLLVRSYLTKKNTYSTGSIPARIRLKNSQIELQKMHLTAISYAVSENSPWILILEDDAVPMDEFFEKIKSIMKTIPAVNTWIGLNSGAGLTRTKSEKLIDELGLFRVKPSATRCAVAYMISSDLTKKILDTAELDGIPNWLPIDLYFQVLLRKFKSKAYWAEPPYFEQGSETGRFVSRVDYLR
jgi:hypothetical protein